MRRKLIVRVGVPVLTLCVVGALTWWYGLRAGWFLPPLPSNPPTAEELERIREVEEASATQAQNAVGGVGVRPVGSLPPRETATTSPEGGATTTATTTDESAEVPEDPNTANELDAESANP